MDDIVAKVFARINEMEDDNVRQAIHNLKAMEVFSTPYEYNRYTDRLVYLVLRLFQEDQISERAKDIIINAAKVIHLQIKERWD
jgi:hypothetical protein